MNIEVTLVRAALIVRSCQDNWNQPNVSVLQQGNAEIRIKKKRTGESVNQTASYKLLAGQGRGKLQDIRNEIDWDRLVY